VSEDWSPDGKTLAILLVRDGATRYRGALLPVEGAREPIFLEAEDVQMDELHFSPDGRWIAYGGFRDGGRWEVFVTAVPPRGQRWQISVGGGMQPRWRHDGRELYYLEPGGALMAVDIEEGGAAVRAAVPRRLFPTHMDVTPNYDQYAAAPDGQRFLLAMPLTPAEPPVEVVANWSAAFRHD